VNINTASESIEYQNCKTFRSKKDKIDGLETVRYCMFKLYSEQLLNVPGVNDGGGEEVKSLTNYMELSPS
jgi:hypothetical protein